METQAAPRPWQARPPIDDIDATINSEPVGPIPATIASVYRNKQGIHCTQFIAEIYNGDTDGGAANAALIVRAVNNYDALMEALSNAQDVIHLSYCSRPSNRGQPCWKECTEARAALLAAEEATG